MNNNNNLFIYKITVGDMCYIGSTKDIKKRIQEHKNVCCNKNLRNYNLKLYKTIREHYGDDWKQVKWSVIDCYYNVDKTFRNEIEQYYIDLFKSQLNMRGTIFIGEKEYRKQYRLDNREKFLEYHKQYYIENRDKILKQMNQKFTCICGSTYIKTNKKRHENSNKHKNYLLKNNLKL